MRCVKYLSITLLLISLGACVQAKSLRVASFNVSMESGNYLSESESATGNELSERLQAGSHPQIRNIAEIIQRVRPDVLLINEFDFTANSSQDIQAFQKNFLSRSQHGQEGIEYPYHFVAGVNTGVPSGQDFNGDGKSDGPDDAFGFGLYPGQYGMLVLSRFPIDQGKVRTFQKFLWKDMPGNLITSIKDAEGRPWFSDQAIEVMRLSSKSHWDIPISVGGQSLHLLASHPTPPVFDGPENRNGKRNHDENRFWVDYIGQEHNYFYDDQGGTGGFKGQRFVIAGDLNASIHEGDAFGEALRQLLHHDKVSQACSPKSEGGKERAPDNPHAANHTAQWGMQADYAIPSSFGLKVTDCGVFWPSSESELHRLVADRAASSDHRLVWVDLDIVE